MKRYFLFSLLCLVSNMGSAQNNVEHGRLKVTPDGHYLQYQDGTPFFWLGDTGWGLFHLLTKEAMQQYFDNRSAKGFNVIQAVVFYESNGFGEADVYGNKPLSGIHPVTPNEQYFVLIDSAIKMAARRNLFVGLMVCWGDRPIRSWGDGTFKNDSLNAYAIGKWLGNRYKNAPNIIWMMGGDTPPKTDTSDARPVWRAMAKGIIEATGHQCLITYHPSGNRTSSQWLHNEPWLDFNMMQSSHGRHDSPNWDVVKKDRSYFPVKPTIDGEPNYEDHPVNPWPKWNADSGYFRDYDVRKQLYRSVFAGALGVTYGHHAIWQFVNATTAIINYADRGWINAMDRPGAYQAGYLKKLIESRPTQERIPDLTIISEGQGITDAEHLEAFRSKENSYAMIYLPVGKTIWLNLQFMKAASITAWWFNPKDGTVLNVRTIQSTAQMKFTPPTIGTENDWVLIVEDAEKKYTTPGN